MNLPTPKLGEITAITITSPDLEKSLQFWQKLGFTEVMQADFPFPWIQITDGALLIMLRKDTAQYLALTYYVKDIETVVQDIEAQGMTFIQKPKDADFVKRYLLKTVDGLHLSLVNIFEGFTQPPGPIMLKMLPSDYMKPEKYVNQACGLFGELAHPVLDLEASISFWQKLGFSAISKFSSPYPWAIISDGLSVLGLHQTKTFLQPRITYFAVDMKEKIEKLISLGLQDYAETKGASNVTVTTPEKQELNLFKLGM